jgi:hypothetical protein
MSRAATKFMRLGGRSSGGFRYGTRCFWKPIGGDPSNGMHSLGDALPEMPAMVGKRLRLLTHELTLELEQLLWCLTCIACCANSIEFVRISFAIRSLTSGSKASLA